jgi:hypothetical protein
MREHQQAQLFDGAAYRKCPLFPICLLVVIRYLTQHYNGSPAPNHGHSHASSPACNPGPKLLPASVHTVATSSVPALVAQETPLKSVSRRECLAIRCQHELMAIRRYLKQDDAKLKCCT